MAMESLLTDYKSLCLEREEVCFNYQYTAVPFVQSFHAKFCTGAGVNILLLNSVIQLTDSNY